MRVLIRILPGLLAVLLCWNASAAAPLIESTQNFGPFGEVYLYRGTPHPKHVVLFISGDSGWNARVVGMARSLAERDALVVGVNLNHYRKASAAAHGRCGSPADDLEALSQYVQKKLGFPDYINPVLAGYSSGAALAYATLVEAPEWTYRGAISLAFRPDLQFPERLCTGRGLHASPTGKGKAYTFAPDTRLKQPWVVLHGDNDTVFTAKEAKAYVAQVPGGKFVELSQVGRDFSAQERWLPQLRAAYQAMVRGEVARATAPAVSDLPLTEVPTTATDGDTFAVLVSGDGGWAAIDKGIASAMAKEGVPVVGLNSLRYFWRPRTPDQAAHALERILRVYLDKWQRPEALLVGYGRGADVLPFMINRLPSDLRMRVRVVALLDLAPRADFEFRVDAPPGRSDDGVTRAVKPEVQQLMGMEMLCVYGSREKGSLCRDLDPALVRKKEFQGDGHFGGDYAALADDILTVAGLRPAP
jgi:type IV secretory pathway VirJ component